MRPLLSLAVKNLGAWSAMAIYRRSWRACISALCDSTHLLFWRCVMLQINALSKLEAFANHLTLHRGLADSTVSNYCRSIKTVLLALGSPEPTQEQFESHILRIRKSKVSHHHIRNTMLAVEHYAGLLGRPITFARPRVARRLKPRTLSEPQVAVLIHEAKKVRQKAMLSLLAYSGLRNEELCNLRVCDVNFGANTIRVINGKYKKSREVCIASECSQIVSDYLTAYPRRPEDYLFTTIRGGRKYNPWALRKIVREIGRKALPGERVHPHKFRATLATCLLERGADLFSIQQQLGHAHVQTTWLYLGPSIERMQREYRYRVPCFV